MLEQLNKVINDLLNKFQKQPEYEELGENLIKEDFSNRGVISAENFTDHIQVSTPTTNIEINPAIVSIASDEDKKTAHDKFLHTPTVETPIKIEEVRADAKPAFTNVQMADLPKAHSQVGNVLRGVAFTFGAVSLILLTYLVFKYANAYLDSQTPVTQTAFVFDNTLVRADNTRTMSVESNVAPEVIRNSVVQAMNNEVVQADKLTVVVPSYLRETTQNNKKVYMSEILRADDFLFTFAPSAPLALRTAASGEYAIGMVNATGKVEGFMAISMNDKVSGLREFLSYEPFMYTDLKDTLSLKTFTSEAKWRDVSVNNHDLRVLADNDGVILVYGFATPKVVVTAPNTDVFEKVSQRLK